MSRKVLVALTIISIISSVVLALSISPTHAPIADEYVPVGGIITPANNLFMIEAWMAILIVILAITVALWWKVKPIYPKI